MTTDYGKYWDDICIQTQDFLQDNGCKDVVIGLSGGIDSSVVAAIAVDTLGPEHTHGVLMPGPHSTPGSVDDASELARRLDIDTVTLSIDDAYMSFVELSDDTIGTRGSDIALQNLQARLRMVWLMHLSNTYGWFVLNTGNKSEAAMGYSTLYGDTCGAFAPIGNVYKTDVYKLAKWRNASAAETGDTEPIPQTVLDKAPSAELYDGQRDVDNLPPYDILDDALRAYFSNEDVSSVAPDAANAKAQIARMVRSASYKRAVEPPGAVIDGFAEPIA
ncbi:MAG: NAD(+) synthase [Coriobacteriales bacterium]|jgi:NAD+ synthase (glutamine-hydrolysing)|nr:NAD(+) synthase [Coriobacteriales bacterium]